MKQFFLTTLMERFLMLTAVFALGFLASCGEDEPEVMPTDIGFTTSAGSIAENSATALTVSVSSSAAILIDGTITVTLSGATYGTDYTTSGGSASFDIDITAGSTFASFDVNPIDNDLFDDDKVITATLSGAIGGVSLGTATTFTITITNDEAYDDISAVRALFDANMAVTITEDLMIKGVVTSTGDATTSRNLFIEDATGAIVLRFDESHSFVQGTDLTVSLMGAEVADFNDLVQVTGTLPLANATDNGAGTMPNTVVTVEQLNSDAFQAQYVTLESVSFPAADGVKTLGGNNDVTDGTVTSVMRVSGSFSGDLLPIGTGNITGVAGIFSGAAQILPQSADGIFANNPTATITVTSAITDFGSIETDVTSASQSYTVSGIGLTENIAVTAPDQFEVSLDDAAFSSSVMVDATAAMAGDVTVHVRFAPTSGISTMVSGDIMHTTLGAATQFLAVSGEEAAIPFVATGTELYISEYAEGTSNNKYVEIYNPTGSSIDLADYQFWGSNNGADWKEERKLQLVGTIAAGDVFIICADAADQIILDEADMPRAFESPVHFNGDDAVGLFKSNGAGGFDLLDVIGVPTEDPGSFWNVAGVTGTQNQTLVRKSTVNTGNTDWAASAGTNVTDSEWIVLDSNDWTNIGFHVSE